MNLESAFQFHRAAHSVLIKTAQSRVKVNVREITNSLGSAALHRRCLLQGRVCAEELSCNFRVGSLAEVTHASGNTHGGDFWVQFVRRLLMSVVFKDGPVDVPES